MTQAFHSFTETQPHPLQMEIRSPAPEAALIAFQMLHLRQPKTEAERFEVQKLAWALGEDMLFEEFSCRIHHLPTHTMIEIRGYIGPVGYEAATCVLGERNHAGVAFRWENCA